MNDNKITDEKIIDVLHTIKKYCSQFDNCKKCILSNCNDDCIFTHDDGAPDEWELTPITKIF